MLMNILKKKIKCQLCQDKPYILDNNINIPCPICGSKSIKPKIKIVNIQDNISEEDSEELKYNIDDFVVNDYEKDLENAIKLSLDSRKKNCQICFNSKINAVFVPCGHSYWCYDCAKKCKKRCPVCRKKCKMIQKIFS